MDALNINAVDLHRIMGCGGYLGIGALPSADEMTDERREGTAAHRVIQYVLNGTVSDADELIDRSIDGYIVTGDMVEYLRPHIEHIQRRELKVYAEQEVNWTAHGAHINCRPDAFSFNETTRTLYMDEPKYGWRVVEPKQNWQMIAGVIGAMFKFGWQPNLIVMTIHQPRPFHGRGPIRKWTIDNAEIQRLYHEINARVASLPKTVTTGAHCYKCDRAPNCPAARMAALAAVDITTDTYHEDLTALQISYELELLERAEHALKVRLDAMKSLATSKGGVPGWAMKNTYGNRKWVEGADADTLAILGGVDAEKLKKPSLVTPAQAEKAGVPKEVVASWTERPSRGFNLVRADTDEDAKQLFQSQQ